MANLILSTDDRENLICGICLDGFTKDQERWTHEGRAGSTHDPFHKPCLLSWVNTDSTCPYDRIPIDRSSILTRIDKIKSVAIHSTCAVIVNITCALSGAIADWTSGEIMIRTAELAEMGAAVTLVTSARVLGGLVERAGIARAAGEGDRLILSLLVPGMLGTLLRVHRSMWNALSGLEQTMMVARIELAGTAGLVIGDVARNIFNHFLINRNDQTYIGSGVYFGGLASLGISLVTSSSSCALITGALVSGISAGILSLMSPFD